MEIESFALSRPIAHWTDHQPPYAWTHGTIFFADWVVSVHIEHGRAPLTRLWTTYEGRMYSARFDVGYTKAYCITLARRFTQEVRDGP